MRRLLSFAAGALTGALAGIGLVLLFTPVSGEALRRQVQARVAYIREEVERAAAERRVRLALPEGSGAGGEAPPPDRTRIGPLRGVR